VAILINSPGGSPVQSRLIYQRIRDLAEEKQKPVHVFIEDIGASGGYMLALAGDQIWADPTSIVGSIGVISASFGLDKAIAKLGIERRVYTAGTNKMSLDPFQPEKADDIERLKSLQLDIHEVFKDMVRERRAGRLGPDDDALFDGRVWSGREAAELGLIDGLANMRTKMRALYGDKVQLKLIAPRRGWLQRRLGVVALSLRGFGLGHDDATSPGFAGDLLSAIEARALWAKFGL